MPTTINGSGITFPNSTSTTTNLIPAGTRMIFRQSAAPTGWTRDTTATGYDQHAIRLVTGAVGTGGSVNFTDAFAAYAPGGGITFSGTATTGSQTAAGTIENASTRLSGTATNTSVAPLGTVAISGSVSSAIIPYIGGKHGVTGKTNSSGSISGTVDNTIAEGTISSETVTLNPDSHNHTTNSTQVASDPPDITVLTDVYATTVTTQTHSHTFTGTSHNHRFSGSFTGDLHQHDVFLHGDGAHTHGNTFSASFTGTPANHSHNLQFTDNGHSHTFNGTPHSHSIDANGLGPVFAGTPRSFAVKYVDCIICSKDA